MYRLRGGGAPAQVEPTSPNQLHRQLRRTPRALSLGHRITKWLRRLREQTSRLLEPGSSKHGYRVPFNPAPGSRRALHDNPSEMKLGRAISAHGHCTASRSNAQATPTRPARSRLSQRRSMKRRALRRRAALLMQRPHSTLLNGRSSDPRMPANRQEIPGSGSAVESSALRVAAGPAYVCCGE